MVIPWQLRVTLVGWFFGLFFLALLIAWVYTRYKGWEKRELPAYTDFKNDLFSKIEQKVLFIPGSTSIFSPDQVLALEHCQRLLLHEKERFAKLDTSIIVGCPFKYEILNDFIRENEIRANVDFLAVDGTGFVMAAQGYIDRLGPSLTFMNATFGFEAIILGDTANNTGVTYQGSESNSPLSDGSIVSKGLFICEEMYSLASYESETRADRLFLIATDICRALIILVILFFSARETLTELAK